jgi:putative membrane protein
MEVELGNLALQHASRSDVKTFAQRMVDDHTKANQQLDDLASKKGITLKEQESVEAKQTIAKLSKLSGEAFDREYAKDMVKDHEKDVAEFEAATKLRDADVKEFATQTLPTLQEHLEMAKKLPQTPTTSRR